MYNNLVYRKLFIVHVHRFKPRLPLVRSCYLLRVKQAITAMYNSCHVTDVSAKTFCVEQKWFILLALLEGKFTFLVEVGETSLCLCSN